VEAAKILGVNVSSIKRWTEDGKLECIKTPGGHRKFNIEQLTKFAKENKTLTSRVNLFPIENATDVKISYEVLKGELATLQERVLEQALACNRDRVIQVLNGLYLADFPLHQIYDQLLKPIFYKIGELWTQQKISILEEHFATQTIRDSIIRLQGIIRLPEKKIGTAFLLNLNDELHDTALKMIDHLLELRGYKVLYSGQITPFFDFKKVIEKFNRPERIYISSSFIIDHQGTQEEFDKICAACVLADVKVFIGGYGFDQLKVNYPEVVMRLYNFKDVFTI
jgi:excisionase family DNA binding protein